MFGVGRWISFLLVHVSGHFQGNSSGTASMSLPEEPLASVLGDRDNRG